MPALIAEDLFCLYGGDEFGELRGREVKLLTVTAAAPAQLFRSQHHFPLGAPLELRVMFRDAFHPPSFDKDVGVTDVIGIVAHWHMALFDFWIAKSITFCPVIEVVDFDTQVGLHQRVPFRSLRVG